MVTSFLNRLGSHACLVAQFGMAVLEDLATVEFLTLSLKILLHHVDVVFVHLLVHSGISNDQNSEFVKTSRDLVAFFLPAITPFEEFLQINHWRFLQLRDHVFNPDFGVFHLTLGGFNR
jgi:hypothetical protein